MRNKKEVAIVIPIYKSDLNWREEISLQQAFKIFSHHDIIIAAPEKIKVQNQGKNCRIERFSEVYFRSVDTYNHLMLSTSFYERFAEYEYILVYQLDAFVFSDELLYFCNLGYDYIGAPWLHGVFHYIDGSHNLWYVGNGGLSLRRVSSFIRILEDRKPLEAGQIKNEDLFFSSIVDGDFKVAPQEIALQFSFEKQVQQCFVLNHNRLPFGCHAWERYDLQFWRPYIEQFGYDLGTCDESGNEDNLLNLQYEWMTCFSKLWEEDAVKQTVRGALLRDMKISQKEYVLFGAGYFGQGLGKWFVHNHIPLKGYCDNNDKLQNQWIEGYQIISLDDLFKLKGKVRILISLLNHVDEVELQLQEIGFERNVDYIRFEDIISVINCVEKRRYERNCFDNVNST